MLESVKTATMLEYLKHEWADTFNLGEKLGWGDERADMHMSWCIGMKEMIENLAMVPVNLRMDGRVSLGLDSEETVI